MPSATRVKTFLYTVTYEVEAINLEKAIAKTQDIDYRVEKTGARKSGEARLRSAPGEGPE